VIIYSQDIDSNTEITLSNAMDDLCVAIETAMANEKIADTMICRIKGTEIVAIDTLKNDKETFICKVVSIVNNTITIDFDGTEKKLIFLLK